MRKLKPGDRVTATGTVKPFSGSYVYVKWDGAQDQHGFLIGVNDKALNLIVPEEPPVGSAVVYQGDVWLHDSGRNGWVSVNASGVYSRSDWSEVCDGEVIYRQEGSW